jgi:hypothetical protein
MSKKSFALRRPRRVRSNGISGAPEIPAANAGQNLVVVAELSLGVKIEIFAPLAEAQDPSTF